ncbi:hypothetical protein [Faecalimonas sp.]
MLIPINKKNRELTYKQLNDMMKKEKEKYKFFGSLSPLQVPGITRLEYLSIEEGIIIGYLSATIDLANERVINISLLSFKFKKEFRNDLMFFINSIYKLYDNFEFRVCDGSPAFKMDEKLFKKFEFEKFGPLRSTIKIDNKYYNEYIFFKNKRAK